MQIPPPKQTSTMNTMNRTAHFPGRFILAADITLTAPLHITAIEKGRYSTDGDRPRLYRYDAGAGAGLQCALTRSRRVMIDMASAEQGEPVAAENEEPAGSGSQGPSSSDIPVIPSSTVGGKLRSLAASLIFESLIKRGQTISTDAFNTLCSGSATTALAGDQAVPEVIRLAREEPFLANFGGTSFALPAYSVIADGWPLIQTTRQYLMSPELLPTEELPNLRWMSQMCSPVAIVRKDPVRELQSSQLHEIVALDDLIQYVEEKGEQAAAAKINKAKAKEAKQNGEAIASTKKTDLRTLSALEAVNTGMSFALRVRVDATTPAQLGLMILAFQKLLRDGQIGGKGARGFGQFICRESRIITIDPNTNNPISDAHERLFSARDMGYEVVGLEDGEDTPITQSVQAAQSYLREINALLIEAFATTNVAALRSIYAAREAK